MPLRMTGWAAVGKIAFAVCCLAAHPAAAETIAGAARVVDGDGLVVAGIEVRLQGVDAPELRQTCPVAGAAPTACGRDAAAALGALVAARRVVCQVDAIEPRDRYGRTLAVCRVGGVDVGLNLIERGLAVAYHRYLRRRPHQAAYAAAEARARADRRGIWGTDFTPPEQWRRRGP